jgi:hypothetical protein
MPFLKVYFVKKCLETQERSESVQDSASHVFLNDGDYMKLFTGKLSFDKSYADTITESSIPTLIL